MSDGKLPNGKLPYGTPEGGWKAVHTWRTPDWVEPILIVSIMLTALWFTRRKNFSILRRNGASYEPLFEGAESPRMSDDYDSLGSPIRTDPHPPKFRTIFGCIRVKTPNSSRFAKYVHSRILQKFPFLIEMFYWAISFFFYRMTGSLAQSYYGGRKSLWEVAQGHGLFLLESEAKFFGEGTRTGPERWLEWRVSHWFLEGAQAGDFRGIWLTILNRGYSMIHIPGTVGFIGYYFAMAPTHARFCTVRRTMTLLNMCAFIIFIFYPCAPPRLMPSEYGFVDTVNMENAESVWMSGKFVNKLAAMPSMHFGYAFAIGCVFVADSAILSLLFGRLRNYLLKDDLDKSLDIDDVEVREIQENRARWKSWAMFAFGIWYPSWILLTIVGTANHYLMDAVVATFCALMAYLCNRALLVFLPAEDMLLWALRLEKPVPTTGRMKNIAVR
ncbi:hypothetical protein COL154_005054 [Colletotrichum chrysophilum]|uniref:Inositolphosphotransferase Aur1/Ipt1 domain-containing protein n=2 Tax=Colletotrichum gloeosporioides species complex TaxID=2707338 RepID=A0A9W4W6T5_9PEZI|nr:hypothetical protein CGCTS75_v000642 [Colletotrichum tropicale]KAH9229551.1 hypothetical protein K456DRAFT_40410 [Colletotrichum gloeosporioides 23]KAJ0298884.1 hypothetical protein Brms1b_013290 [Colletotrichum noveboracense]KAJ0364367.1 hypothetical protein COL154_005054 [Colletotrichum chrysophilum]KAJ3957431.1 hypothetical protein N0V92_005980 [Colletotrichum tropicale]